MNEQYTSAFLVVLGFCQFDVDFLFKYMFGRYALLAFSERLKREQTALINRAFI